MSIYNGGAGNDVLRGTNSADWMFGGSGDDKLDGLGGNDVLFGGAGRDTLNGGSGNDLVDGGLGNDLLIYSFGENRGSHDIYNGGFGTDTLRLVLTAAEWARADVKADVARFLAYLPEYNEPLGWLDDPVFNFRSMGLSLVGINKLEIVVDGKIVNIADAPVVTAADTVAVTEDAGATVNLLANDWVADGVKSVSIAQPARGAVALVSTDFASDTPSAIVRFTPTAGAFDYLAAGETATETFRYTVTDRDGDTRTETVTATITGVNDGPVITRADSTVTFGEDEANSEEFDFGQFYPEYFAEGVIEVSDPDGRGELGVEALEAPGDYVGTFAAYLDDEGRPAWQFYVGNRSLDFLDPGEVLTQVYQVRIDDGQGGSVLQAVTVTVTGENDAPTRGRIRKPDFVDADGTRTGTTRIFFDDEAADSHTVDVVARTEDAIGTASGVVGQLRDGRRYVDITFSYDLGEIAALGQDALEQRYKITVTDASGEKLVVNRTVLLDERTEWSIGGEGDDYLYEYGFETERAGEVMVGNGGSDYLSGGMQADELYGDEGPALPDGVIDRNDYDNEPGEVVTYDDTLSGGGGADLLVGGRGADTFTFDPGDADYDGVRDHTTADGDVIRDFDSAEGDRLVFRFWDADTTFSRVDATHWELADADRSIVEVITFENAADLQPGDWVFV